MIKWLKGSGVLVLSSILFSPAASLATEEKRAAVTFFPKDLTIAFKKAFKKKHPSVRVEIRDQISHSFAINDGRSGWSMR